MRMPLIRMYRSNAAREVTRRVAGLTEERVPRIRFAQFLNQLPESTNSSIPGVAAAQEVIVMVRECLGTQSGACYLNLISFICYRTDRRTRLPRALGAIPSIKLRADNIINMG